MLGGGYYVPSILMYSILCCILVFESGETLLLFISSTLLTLSGLTGWKTCWDLVRVFMDEEWLRELVKWFGLGLRMG